MLREESKYVRVSKRLSEVNDLNERGSNSNRCMIRFPNKKNDLDLCKFKINRFKRTRMTLTHIFPNSVGILLILRAPHHYKAGNDKKGAANLISLS